MWGKRADMVVHEQDPYNAEPELTALAEHAFTPLDTFYVRNHGPVPEIDPQQWRLRVDGLVDDPLELSLEDLKERFETHQLAATLQCAGNRRAGLDAVREIPGEDLWRGGATSTARWTGVRLADVLSRAGLQPDAAHIAFEAPDVSQIADPAQPYGSSIPRAKAQSPEVLLAWAMNDQDLPPVHGAPLRVVVPGYVGARNVKWLQRVVASQVPSRNWFQATAYRVLPAEADPEQAGPGDGISLGAVALNCEILNPSPGEAVPAGPFRVQGYAHAGGDREVARVDVSVDGGRHWVQADLGEGGPWVWRRWSAQVQLPAGACRVVARAWDTSGASQPESPVHLWNPKGYVNNSWPVVDVVGG